MTERTVPGRDTDPVFSRTYADAAGCDVRLELLPRKLFAGVGWQFGFRLSTWRDGQQLMQQSIGITDEDADALVQSIMLEKSPT